MSAPLKADCMIHASIHPSMHPQPSINPSIHVSIHPSIHPAMSPFPSPSTWCTHPATHPPFQHKSLAPKPPKGSPTCPKGTQSGPPTCLKVNQSGPDLPLPPLPRPLFVSPAMVPTKMDAPSTLEGAQTLRFSMFARRATKPRASRSRSDATFSSVFCTSETLGKGPRPPWPYVSRCFWPGGTPLAPPGWEHWAPGRAHPGILLICILQPRTRALRVRELRFPEDCVPTPGFSMLATLTHILA